MIKQLLLLALVLRGTLGLAQIPNGSFEVWYSLGSYLVPAQWDNLNSVTDSTGTYTCMQDTPGTAGSYYLKLISKTTGGLGVLPGIVSCGLLDKSNLSDIKVKSGFAFSQRPQSLTGSWQFMAYGGDHGYMDILLTKWDSGLSKRDTVAETLDSLTGMWMSWTPFSIGLNYRNSSYPDTCMIVFSASGANPVENSYLYIDNLAFNGSATGLAPVINDKAVFFIYPNPAKSIVNISCNSLYENEITLSVIDIAGRCISTLSKKVYKGANNIPLDVSVYTRSVYFIRIVTDENTTTQKLLIE